MRDGLFYFSERCFRQHFDSSLQSRASRDKVQADFSEAQNWSSS
jgi:hypothetical protein